MPLSDAPSGDRKRARTEDSRGAVSSDDDDDDIRPVPARANAESPDEDEGNVDDLEDELHHYEEDYLACRAMTQHIKDLVISSIGGDLEENRRTIEFCISRGRCSFTKTFRPPPVILQENPTLKEYQVAAVHWLLTLYENGYNGLLADDMGLGKSAESICFLKRLYVDNLLTKPTIITCPTTLLDNWMNELHRWAPGLKVMRYHGTQNERRQLMRQFELGSDYEDENEEDEEEDDDGGGDEPETQEEVQEATHEEIKSEDAESGAGDEDVTVAALSTGVSVATSNGPGDESTLTADENVESKGPGLSSFDDEKKTADAETVELSVDGVKDAEDAKMEDGTTDEAKGPEEAAKMEEPAAPQEYYPLPDGVAYHVLVTSHPTLASSHDRQHFFKVQEFGFLVVDEAHGLKNAASNRYQQINKSVRAPLRLLLTGSPIQNQMSELKNLLGFLNPYRGAESFDLERALAYHKKVWEQALQREKERETLKSTLPGLLSDAVKLDAEENSINPTGLSKPGEGLNNNNAPPSNDVNSSTPGSQESNMSSSKGDPEIHFYQQLLAPLILRRLKAEVIHNFPSKTSKIELLDMHPEQLTLYHRELKNSKGILTASARGGMTKKTSQTAIKGLIFRLRRICNHPLLLQSYFSPSDREEFARYLQTRVKEYRKFTLERVMQHIQDWSDFDLHNEAYHHLPALQNFRIPKGPFGYGCKTNRLLELIMEKCVKQNEKMLIFSQFTTYLDIIQEFLKLYCPDVEHLRLDGSTAVNDRSAMVSSFQNNTSNAKLFLLSTKAGGVGLNLTSSNTVVLMDQDWNPHNDRQAEDRVHRLGQTGDVTVYRLCCRHSFEESVLSCCKKKLELDEAFGGVQEALPLEIFEEILRDAQTMANPPEAAPTEPEDPAGKKKKSPKKVIKSKSPSEASDAPAKPKKKVGATKRTAEKVLEEANQTKKTNAKPTTKKSSKRVQPTSKEPTKHENSLLPSGDSD